MKVYESHSKTLHTKRKYCSHLNQSMQFEGGSLVAFRFLAPKKGKRNQSANCFRNVEFVEFVASNCLHQLLWYTLPLVENYGTYGSELVSSRNLL
jgi:hypothetical protein